MPAAAADLCARLAGTADELAAQWLIEPAPIADERRLDYHRALWKLREVAAEIVGDRTGANSCLSATLDAFAARFIPGAVVAARPAGLAAITVREQLGPLRDRLSNIGVDAHALDAAAGSPRTSADDPATVRAAAGRTAPPGAGAHQETPLTPAADAASAPGATATPDQADARLLVVRYPQGEQEHTLMACCALPYFQGARTSHVLAAANGGPAYFFALAAEMQNNKGFRDHYDPPRLCFVGNLLEAAGWLDHAEVGPLIRRWREHFGIDRNYLERVVTDANTLRAMHDALDGFAATTPTFSPAEFDAAAARVWDRLDLQEAGVVNSPRRSRFVGSHGTERLPASRAPNGAAPAPFAHDGAADADTSGSVAAGSGPETEAVDPSPGPSEARLDVIAVLNAGWVFAQTRLAHRYTRPGCSAPHERAAVRRRLNRHLAAQIPGTGTLG